MCIIVYYRTFSLLLVHLLMLIMVVLRAKDACWSLLIKVFSCLLQLSVCASCEVSSVPRILCRYYLPGYFMISEVYWVFNFIVALITFSHHLFKIFLLKFNISYYVFSCADTMIHLLLLDHLLGYFFVLLLFMSSNNYWNLLLLHIDNDWKAAHLVALIVKSHIFLQVVGVKILKDKYCVANKFFVGEQTFMIHWEFYLALLQNVRKDKGLIPFGILPRLSGRLFIILAIHAQFNMDWHLEELGLAHIQVSVNYSDSQFILLLHGLLLILFLWGWYLRIFLISTYYSKLLLTGLAIGLLHVS